LKYDWKNSPSEILKQTALVTLTWALNMTITESSEEMCHHVSPIANKK